MHGQARTVERKILLWIAQQERNRREEGALRLLDARGDASAADLHRRGGPRPRMPSRTSS